MKVILLQNVPKLGQKGEIKDVNEGFARNSLIPRKLVKTATSAEIKKIRDEENRNKSMKQKVQNKAGNIIRQLNGREVEIKEKANEKGHLFAQVHLTEIADAIATLGFDISEDWIILENPIKEIGEFEVPLQAYETKGKIKVVVVGE
jgi:large subunit ribosomal protein L9